MNRVLGPCLAALTVATGAISLASGCAHDDSSMFVQAVIFPQPQGAGTSCVYSANPQQIFLSRGTLDIGVRPFEYDAVFLLANQLVAVSQQSNSTQVETEDNDINIEGAIVRVTDAAGNTLSNYTSLTSGTIYAAVGGTPGYAVIDATAIDQASIQKSGVGPQNPGTKTLVSYLKFFGHTLGGSYIESNEFEFPVNVCYGCLVSFSTSDINPCYQNVNCLGGGTGGSSGQTVPCRPGQDTPVDCSQCQGSPVCSPNPGMNICDGGTAD